MATILVVDDSATNRALLSRILDQHGHRIIEAGNGAEALGLVRVEAPDVVVTDVLMPKVDGYEFERHLRADPTTAAIPVVFHTAAYTAKEVLEVAGTSELVQILRKPVEVQEVLETVDAALARKVAVDGGRPAGGDHHEHLALLNAKLLQKVRELELVDRERQELLAHVIRAQEEERERIAADIHDDPVQAMTAVAMRLDSLARWLDDPEATERHEKLKATVRDAIARLRRLLFQLHPGVLDEEGLAAAVTAFLDHTVGRGGPSYDVIETFHHEPPQALRTVLYRVVQEALVNVAKHADATAIRVELRQSDDGYHATVEDDGSGFVVDQSHFVRRDHIGLSSMRQRAELVGGTWRIDSAPGAGTTLEVFVPHVVDAHETAS